jgi:hypothetical protein
LFIISEMDFIINGMNLSLEAEYRVAQDAHSILEACCVELLGHGNFPHGLEHRIDRDDDISDIDASYNGFSASYAKGKAALKSFLKLFSILLSDEQSRMTLTAVEGDNTGTGTTIIPSIPMPPVLSRSDLFFMPPRSKREILAKERAEEEMMEEAVARFVISVQWRAVITPDILL